MPDQLTDNQKRRELEHAKRSELRETPKKKGIIQRLGSGKTGRFGKAAAASLMLGSAASGGSAARMGEKITATPQDKQKQEQLIRAQEQRQPEFVMPTSNAPPLHTVDSSGNLTSDNKTRQVPKKTRSTSSEPEGKASETQLPRTILPALAVGQAISKKKAGEEREEIESSERDSEEQWGRDLVRERMGRLRGGFNEKGEGIINRLRNPELNLDDPDASRAINDIQAAITSGSTLKAMKAGAEVGVLLRGRIAQGNLKAFAVALGLAIAKDFIDIPSLGTVGSILNIIITVALLGIILFQGIMLKRFIIKTFWKRGLGVVVAEFIPFINFFPFWTISVLLVKRSVDKKRKQYELALEKLEADLEELERMPSPKKAAKAEKKAQAKAA